MGDQRAGMNQDRPQECEGDMNEEMGNSVIIYTIATEYE